MTKLAENLILFNNGKRNVYATIRTLIARLEEDSKNTASTYLRHYKDFFQTMRGKDLEDLTETDIVFEKSEIKNYQIRLKGNHKANTVNNTIAALKKLYKEFKDDGFDVDPEWFSIKRFKASDIEPHDILTHEEVNQIVELLEGTRKGFEKQLMVRVAYATAFRREAISNLKWDDLKQVDGYWVLETLDKGQKKDIKKIGDSLYQDLMKHKETSESEYIFQLTKLTVTRMMKYIRGNMDFGSRKITFHSFKKASINQVGFLTNGDVKAMQRHGNHATAKTTLDNYVKNTDLDDMVIIDVDHKVDLSVFEEMSKEELLQLIKNSDTSTQVKLLQSIDKK